jgi:nucleotide-binding universal stress UspA family protein
MKILIVTNDSPQTVNTLEFSAQIARSGAELPTILTVIPESTEKHKSRANNILTKAVELVGVQNARTLIRTGKPFNNIIQEANEGEYDLVIIGDKRSKNIFSWTFRSSLAIKVAECAPCSVIMVRGKTSGKHRILLCDSGGGLSPLLSRLVIQLSGLLEGEEDVTVLHVMSQMSAGPGIRGSQLRATAQELVEEHTPEGELLERDLHMLEKPGIHPIPKVRHGLVVEEILAEARSGNYDLVVLGAHPVNEPRRFLLDDIAHQIMKQINRPILIVRDKAAPPQA